MALRRESYRWCDLSNVNKLELLVWLTKNCEQKFLGEGKAQVSHLVGVLCHQTRIPKGLEMKKENRTWGGKKTELTDRQTCLFGVLYNKQYVNHNFQITKNYKQHVIN